MSRRAPRGGPAPEWPNEPGNGNGYPGGENGVPGSRYGQHDRQYDQYGRYGGQYGQYGEQGSRPTQTFNYQGVGGARQGAGGARQGAPGARQGAGGVRQGAGGGTRQGNGDGRYQRNGDARGYGDERVQGDTRRYRDPRQFNGQGYRTGGQRRYQAPGLRPGAPERAQQSRRGRGPGPKVRFRRIRKLMRYRTARVISAILAVILVWGMFSAGQATFANNGQSATANLAEWFRDHHMGALVTLGEYLTYNPPKVGGKPSFSLSVPKGEAVTSAPKTKSANAFVPDIPAPLKSLASTPLEGEGQWRVVDKVDGQPAIFTTFLRDATYTSYVNGVASIDPRLVEFQLHPGSEDPGPGNWGAWGSDYIKPGARTGLVATFNSGFKLDAAGGGFYLNGHYHGSLVAGAASVVYYKNGTVKIGTWGSEVSMSPQVEAVRQNLKLLVDHGQLASSLNHNIESSWGATLGGGYYVWRSGLGITKDGRIVYVYGPALNVQDLAELLRRAGAVEAMQLDINPYWMKFEYYSAGKSPSDPSPTNLLPTQQQSAYSYYSPYTRDFTAVYARSKPYVK